MIGGRVSRFDCFMFLLFGVMNVSLSVVFVDVMFMLLIVERLGWLYRLCVCFDVLLSFVFFLVFGKGVMGCEGGVDEIVLGLFVVDMFLFIVRLI